jgi:hypothetical protein
MILERLRRSFGFEIESNTDWVAECLLLGNHNIIAIIFSLIDCKKRLSRRDADERFYLSTAQGKVKNSTKDP